MTPKPHLPGTPRPAPKPAGRDWIGLFLSIWESEHVLSLRLLIAASIAAFALIMRGRGVQYMTTDESIKYLDVVKDLMLIGAAKIALSRFSPKPTVDPTQQPPTDAAQS
ncbi:MAG: hypothetical protein ACRYFZ_09465 [Janthinobacterium lividum]